LIGRKRQREGGHHSGAARFCCDLVRRDSPPLWGLAEKPTIYIVTFLDQAQKIARDARATRRPFVGSSQLPSRQFG
jgi:hypothetical protein